MSLQSRISAFVSAVAIDYLELKGLYNSIVPKFVTSSLSADTSTFTASNYRSFAPSTVVESQNLTLSWSNDIFTVSESGWYEIILQTTFTNASTTGNRLTGLLRNFTAETLNSSTAPGAGYRLRWVKFPPTSDSAGAIVVWKGYLYASDQIMCIARTTSATKVSGTPEETHLTVTKFRG